MNRFLLFVFVFCQGFSALGASTWDRGAGTNNWCDADNWSGNSLPDAGDDVTIGSGFTVIIGSSCNALSKKLRIDGSLTVDSGGSLITSDDVELKNNNTAVFENNGTVTIGGKLKAEPGGGSFGDGPSVINNSTMNISSELNIGNGAGAGSLTNSGTITADKAHIDGSLCNSGIITATREFKNHGGEVTCGGTINTPLVEFDDNGGRPGIFGAQNISDGNGCSGSNSGGVEYDFGGGGAPDPCPTGTDPCSFQEFIDDNGETDGALFEFSDPGNFTSCGTSGAAALPVELLYFTAGSIKGFVELNWSTASEKNNDHFEIENSVDGFSFSKIGEVKGNGTTNEVMKYAFVDQSPQGIESYYRLKQVDYDGQHAYFNTIRVQTTGSSSIRIYPNPTSANSTLVVQLNNSLEPDLVNVELTDLTGRIIQKKLGYGNSFELSTKSLVKGTYFVRVSINSLVLTSKVLVD